VDSGDQLTMSIHWRERDWACLRETMRDEESVVWGALAAYGLLKFFECSLVHAQEYLFQLLIAMWSLDLQCFIFWCEHITFSMMEDVYLLTGLPFQGTLLQAEPMVPGDGQLADLAWTYCLGEDFMSGSVVRIGVMDSLVHFCMAAMIVRVYVSLVT
jgi:hypothetical protein